MSDLTQKIAASLANLAKLEHAKIDAQLDLALAIAVIFDVTRCNCDKFNPELIENNVLPIEKWMTVEEVAEMIGEKPDTIYGKASRDEIPHLKTGVGKSGLRFLPSEIIKWGKENAEASQKQEKTKKRKFHLA